MNVSTGEIMADDFDATALTPEERKYYRYHGPENMATGSKKFTGEILLLMPIGVKCYVVFISIVVRSKLSWMILGMHCWFWQLNG